MRAQYVRGVRVALDVPRSAILVTLVATVGACISTGVGARTVAEGGRPSWVTDLRKSGFVVDRENPPKAQDAGWQIAFGSSDELVVLNTLPKAGTMVPVHAFVLDSSSGRVIRQLDWNVWRSARVFATTRGKYAVPTERGTSLYGPGLAEVLATTGEFVDLASPNGRRLAARVHKSGDTFWLGLDGDTLRPDGAEFRKTYMPSISASGIADVSFPRLPDDPVVRIQLNGRSDLQYEPHCKEVRVRFLSENAIGVSGCGRVDVITVDGKPLISMTGDMGHDVFATARTVARFAVSQAAFDTSDRQRLQSERITVFDMDKTSPILAIENQDLRGEDSARSGVALSPDGSTMAVHSWGKVKLYRMPG